MEHVHPIKISAIVGALRVQRIETEGMFVVGLHKLGCMKVMGSGCWFMGWDFF